MKLLNKFVMSTYYKEKTIGQTLKFWLHTIKIVHLKDKFFLVSKKKHFVLFSSYEALTQLSSRAFASFKFTSSALVI